MDNYVKIHATRGIFMKNIFGILGVFGLVASYGVGAMAVSAGTATGARYVSVNTTTASGSRGNAGVANAYKQNQRNTYYMVTQPDVDSACRDKIYKCLSDYCGDTTPICNRK